jgi:hypothetical protein
MHEHVDRFTTSCIKLRRCSGRRIDTGGHSCEQTSADQPRATAVTA